MGRKKKWQAELAALFATVNCKLSDRMIDRKTEKKEFKQHQSGAKFDRSLIFKIEI